MRAGSPPDSADLGEVRAALACASEFHCTDVCAGAELLHVDRDVAEPAVDRHQTRGQVALPVPPGGLAHGGRPVAGPTRNPVPSTTIRSTCRRRRGRGSSSSCAPCRASIDRASRSTSGDCPCAVMTPAVRPFPASACALRFSSTSTCHFSLAAVVSTSISKRSVMSGRHVGDVDVELLIPPPHLVDRAVLLDQQRIVDAGLVLPDLDVLQEALADAFGERPRAASRSSPRRGPCGFSTMTPHCSTNESWLTG